MNRRTRRKKQGPGSAVGDHQDEGELASPQRGKKFARMANFWTRTSDLVIPQRGHYHHFLWAFRGGRPCFLEASLRS